MRLNSFSFVLGIAAILIVPLFALQAEENPEACNALFGLPKGTIRMEADRKIMNPEVCAAYEFLISRYAPGPRSSVGLSNPKVEGIIKLNPDFAVALAKMLENAPYMAIFSAYRTPEGQGSKNPESNHIYGCAVDLGYGQHDCNSALCQWVSRNAPGYGLQIRMRWDPEWNHVEPIAKDACRNNGPGVGVPVARPPSSGLVDSVRDSLEEKCALPDGVVVPCSAIANRNAPAGGSGGVASSAQQALPASQQPFQSLPPAKPVSNLILPEIKKGSASATTSTSTLSAFEKIRIFVEQKTPTSTTTSTPFMLVVSGQDAAGIENENTVQTTPVPERSYQLSPPTSQNTFTSVDLSGRTSSVASQGVTGYQKILADMKSSLLLALEYLRPFGRPVSDEQLHYEYDDWSE